MALGSGTDRWLSPAGHRSGGADPPPAATGLGGGVDLAPGTGRAPADAGAAAVFGASARPGSGDAPVQVRGDDLLGLRDPCRPVPAQRGAVRAGGGRYLALAGAEVTHRPGPPVSDPAGHRLRAGHRLEGRSGRVGNSPRGEFDRDRPGPAGHPWQRDVGHRPAVRASVRGGRLARTGGGGGPGDRHQLAGGAAFDLGAGDGGDSPQADQRLDDPQLHPAQQNPCRTHPHRLFLQRSAQPGQTSAQEYGPGNQGHLAGAGTGSLHPQLRRLGRKLRSQVLHSRLWRR